MRAYFAAASSACALLVLGVSPAMGAHSHSRPCGTVTVAGGKITVRATGRMSCRRARHLTMLTARFGL